MAVRNFYVLGEVDGRVTAIEGGPRNRNGGMSLWITQRKNNDIVSAFRITCRVMSDGRLATRIFDGDWNQVGELVTDR